MSEFKKYRKKPVVIEARELTEPMDISTLEGVMHGNVGDYLIIGVAGEQYPCRRDIFERTYESVEDEPLSRVAKYTIGDKVKCCAEEVTFTGVVEQYHTDRELGTIYHVDANVQGGGIVPLFVQEDEIVERIEEGNKQ